MHEPASFLRVRSAVLGLALAALSAGAVAPGRALAQDAKSVESSVQGTVGFGLIGAELGLVLPAVIGLEDTWPYIVFPVALGGGGAAAGYFLIDKNDEVKAGVGILAAGVALIIPAVVTTLALTAYDPEDEVKEAKEKKLESKDFGDTEETEPVPPAGSPLPTGNEPAEEAPVETPAAPATEPAPAPAEAPPAGGGAPATPPRADVSGGFGLVRMRPSGAIIVGVPSVSVAPMYSQNDVSRFGLRQASEIRVPLFTGTF
jgi:hypothetical protein